MHLEQSIASGEFWRLGDHDIVRLIGDAFAPELQHLCKAKNSVEASGLANAGGSQDEPATPSHLLFNEEFAEVNRTLISILSVKWVMNDDYETFTCRQNKGIRLSRSSWTKLRNYLRENLRESRDVLTLLVAIIVNDIGKDLTLLQSLRAPRNGTEESMNHDQAALAAFDASLIPGVACLSQEDQLTIRLGMELAAKLNVSQLAQGENVPGSLTVVRETRSSKRAFNIKMMEVILDVAGAGAGMEAKGAVMMTEPVFQTYFATIEALSSFAQGDVANEEDCYNLVLLFRSKILEADGFPLLTATIPAERALLRLFAIGRVANKKDADLFSSAFFGLLPNIKQQLQLRLNATGLSLEDRAVIPYYAPGLCAVILREFKGESYETRLRALKSFMAFLCRACDPSTIEFGHHENIVERDISFATQLINSTSFLDHPESLADLAIL